MARIGNSIRVGRVFGEYTARSPTTRGRRGRSGLPAAAPRWMSGRRFPWAPGRCGDRSDAPVGLTRTPNVPARDRGVGVRLRESGGPRRVVAWRPVQTVPGSREDSARRRGRPSPRGRLRRPVVGQPFQGDDAHRTVAGGTREGVRRIECRALPRDRSCVRQVALVTRAIQTIPQTTLPYGVTVIRRRADSGDAPGFPTSTTTS